MFHGEIKSTILHKLSTEFIVHFIITTTYLLLNCKHLYFIVDIKIFWSQISRDYVNNHVEMYSTVQHSTPLQLGIANVEMY